MASKADFSTVFEQLRTILRNEAGELEVIKDEPGDYSLNGGYSEQYRKVIWFGGVKITRNYVSYHLIGIYAFPHLRAELSPELRRRMQGKSCFNFTQLDAATLKELASVTARSVEEFRRAKWLEVK